MNPFHRLKFFSNCPIVGPIHGVQSFRNSLLQHGSPMGSQALPANLLQHELLSPWGHRSYQELVQVWAVHRVTPLFGHPPAPAWGLPRAAGGYLLHHGPPWAAGRHPASPRSTPWAAGESLLWCLEHPLPLPLH